MHFEFAYLFLFLSYSFGIETIKTFIHSRNSLENHTRFQIKMGKVYTRFKTKNGAKTLPYGAAHTYMAYIRKHPPPPRGKKKASEKPCNVDPKIPMNILSSYPPTFSSI